MGAVVAASVTSGRKIKSESETLAGPMSSRSAGASWAASGRGLCLSYPVPGRRGHPFRPAGLSAVGHLVVGPSVAGMRIVVHL